MARKKVKLEWISNDTARRATLKKRRNGLLKKVAELSTLCDVKACLIFYSPNEPHPEVWPSPNETNRVLAKLQRLPEMEQSKRMMNQEGFMRHRVAKLREQLRKHERENLDLETTLLMYQGLKGMKMDNIEMASLTSLSWLIELKLKAVQKRELILRSEEVEKQEMKKVELPPMEEVKNQQATPTHEGNEKMMYMVELEALLGDRWISDITNSYEEDMPDVPFFENLSTAPICQDEAYYPWS